MGRGVQGSTALGADAAIERSTSPLVPDELTLCLAWL